MKLRILLVFFSLIYLFLSCTTTETDEESNQKPNIIILFCDDLGYGDLGIFGHPTIKTPNLDNMAEEGMKLTQFYVAAPVCTPSRSALVTGRLPIRTGMCSDKRAVLFPDSDGGLQADETTIAEGLKNQGYATACVGKWHLGHLPQYLPTNHGFDYYFGIPYSNDMRPAHLIEGTSVIEEKPDQGYLTKRYTEKAIGFIKTNKEKPIFLYLPYTMPHVPLFASPEFDSTSARGLYGDVVEEIDWSVGEIFKTLREEGMDKNTFVFFTSDNGPWLVMGENGGSAGLLRDGKGSCWEGGMREPSIAWWPGKIKAGAVTQALGTTMDLFPTAMEIAGGTMPTDKPYDGVSLLPVLTERQESVRDVVFYYRGQQLYAIRKGAWKAHFITIEGVYTKQNRVTSFETPLLFNVETDPSERFNVAEKHPDVIEEILKVKEDHESNLIKAPSQLEKRISS